MVGDHFPAASGGEDTPPGSEVEPINLDDVVDLTGDINAGAELPAPADLVSEGAPGSACLGVGLGMFPHEPVEEAQQGEDSAAVVTFTD